MNSVFTKKLHFPQNAVRRAVKHDILHIGCKSILLGIYTPSMVQKQWILTESQALIKSLQKSLIYPQNVGRRAVKHDIPYGMWEHPFMDWYTKYGADTMGIKWETASQKL